MQIKWSITSDECNFKINHDFLKSNLISNACDSSQCFSVFSHVPKTAGTSIESILIKNFAPPVVMHINAPDLNKLPQVLKLKKHPPKLICGHHPIHGMVYQLLPNQPIFHFTQLREPLDRVLSYYNYIRGKADHPLHEYAINSSITDFLRTNSSPELSNGQAKRFSGYLHSGTPTEATLLSVAKDTLTNCFSLVLTTCLFDEGLLLLKNRINLRDIFYQRSNVSKKFLTKDELSDSELSLMKEMNQVDIKLFTWAKTQCLELINNELTEEQITKFRNNNSKWNSLMNS